MKYCTKAVVVDAVRFGPGIWPDGVQKPPPHERGMGYGYLDTADGRVRVEWGDWIVTGANGERYACKDAAFRAAYEPVDPASAAGKSVNVPHNTPHSGTQSGTQSGTRSGTAAPRRVPTRVYRVELLCEVCGVPMQLDDAPLRPWPTYYLYRCPACGARAEYERLYPYWDIVDADPPGG